MLTAIPKSWCSWDFRLQEGEGAAWGEVDFSFWRERGSVLVGGDQYSVTRQGLGPFVLEGPGGTLVEAVKPSMFKQEFRLTVGGRDYVLRKLSLFGREFGLFRDDVHVGSVRPEAWFTRRAQVMLPDDLPTWGAAFIVWLTLLMWKRDAGAGGGATAAVAGV